MTVDFWWTAWHCTLEDNPLNNYSIHDNKHQTLKHEKFLNNETSAKSCAGLALKIGSIPKPE
jgi:hypothetical protein